MPKKDGKIDPKDDPYEKINGDDVKAGLVAVLSMKVPEPEFVGQTKDKLGNPEVRGIVDSLVKEKLTIFFEQNPHVVEKVLEKAVAEATARIAARKAKDATLKFVKFTLSKEILPAVQQKRDVMQKLKQFCLFGEKC